MILQPASSGESSAPVSSWLADFTPYSLQHAVSSGFFLGAIALAIFVGVKRRGTSEEVKLRRLWGWIALFTMIVDLIWWCRPSEFNIGKSLPLYVCDIAGWLAAIYMLTDSRIARVLLYYFGLFLSAQAFITPVIGVGQGMATGRFWLFYLTHVHIVGVALYDLIVLRYRPTWRDCAIAIGLGVAYVASMFALNHIIDHFRESQTDFNRANYGFMGSSNDPNVQPGAILLFGPYPLRIIWISLAVSALFVVATAFWRLIPRAHATSRA